MAKLVKTTIAEANSLNSTVGFPFFVGYWHKAMEVDVTQLTKIGLFWVMNTPKGTNYFLITLRNLYFFPSNFYFIL